jgi:hypothetical protein
VGRASIQEKIIHVAGNTLYIRHFQVNLQIPDSCIQGTLNSQEYSGIPDQADRPAEHDCTPAAVTAQTPCAIRINVNHFEIVFRMIPDQDQSVCADTEFPVTEVGDQGEIIFGENFPAVIDHDEVISCSLVFFERNGRHVIVLSI